MDEWISFDEGCPEHDMGCLILWKCKYCNRLFYAICEFEEENGFLLEELSVYKYYKNAEMEVVYWMPLPEIPVDNFDSDNPYQE